MPNNFTVSRGFASFGGAVQRCKSLYELKDVLTRSSVREIDGYRDITKFPVFGPAPRSRWLGELRGARDKYLEFIYSWDTQYFLVRETDMDISSVCKWVLVRRTLEEGGRLY